MQLFDRLTLDGVRRTANGYLVADSRSARTGIQVYRGSELGKPEIREVRVYRPEDEVFSKDTLHSFAYKPITNGHPPTMVDSKNWKDYSIGHTGGDVIRDREFVRVPLLMTDEASIKQVEDGKRELSWGYDCKLVWRDGETEDGEHYDAVQTNIRANHLAVVAVARGGRNLKIGDDNQGATDMETRKVMVDGLQVETTDAGAAAINKLQGDIAAKDAAIKAGETALAARDGVIAAKDGEIANLKAKVLDAKAIDAAIATRMTLIDSAKKLAGEFKHEGLSDADIRKMVVTKKLGDQAVAGRDDAFFTAAFDTMSIQASAASPGSDSLRDAIRNPSGDTVNLGDARAKAIKAYEDNVTAMRDGWKSPAKSA